MQLLLSTRKKFRINLLYCCFYFPYPKSSAKIYYAILLLLLSIQFFLQKFTILLHLHSIPKTFRINLLYCYDYFQYPNILLHLHTNLKISTIFLLLLSIPKKFRKNLLYCYFNYFLYLKNSTKKYYMATFTIYTQKFLQKSTILQKIFL